MERLTDRKTAADLKKNYEGLRAAGMPRNIPTERYIKLAEFEDIQEQGLHLIQLERKERKTHERNKRQKAALYMRPRKAPRLPKAGVPHKRREL